MEGAPERHVQVQVASQVDSVQGQLTKATSPCGLAIPDMAETSKDGSSGHGEGMSVEDNQKASPPEPPAVTRTRSWIIFAFWAIVACLGLPHWIWTTSIHRSDLPLDAMNSWADGQVRIKSGPCTFTR